MHQVTGGGLAAGDHTACIHSCAPAKPTYIPASPRTRPNPFSVHFSHLSSLWDTSTWSEASPNLAPLPAPSKPASWTTSSCDGARGASGRPGLNCVNRAHCGVSESGPSAITYLHWFSCIVLPETLHSSPLRTLSLPPFLPRHLSSAPDCPRRASASCCRRHLHRLPPTRCASSQSIVPAPRYPGANVSPRNDMVHAALPHRHTAPPAALTATQNCS